MPEPVDIPRGKPCPICSKPSVLRFRPFCSKRCADIDLNRWFSGVYVVPASENEPDTDETPGDGEPPEQVPP